MTRQAERSVTHVYPSYCRLVTDLAIIHIMPVFTVMQNARVPELEKFFIKISNEGL